MCLDDAALSRYLVLLELALQSGLLVIIMPDDLQVKQTDYKNYA
jgi:hypothetical protein